MNSKHLSNLLVKWRGLSFNKPTVIAVCLTSLICLVIIVAPPPTLPSAADAVSFYRKHERELGLIAEIVRRHCRRMSGFDEETLRDRLGDQDERVYSELMRETGLEFRPFCNERGNMRIVLAEQASLLTVGPERVIGLELITSDPDREGSMVKDIDQMDKSQFDVYLQPLGGGWYVFYQNTD